MLLPTLQQQLYFLLLLVMIFDRFLLTVSYCSCVPYVPDPENTTLLMTALQLFRKFKQLPQAMRLAMQLNSQPLIEEIFLECGDL